MCDDIFLSQPHRRRRRILPLSEVTFTFSLRIFACHCCRSHGWRHSSARRKPTPLTLRLHRHEISCRPRRLIPSADDTLSFYLLTCALRRHTAGLESSPGSDNERWESLDAVNRPTGGSRVGGARAGRGKTNILLLRLCLLLYL